MDEKQFSYPLELGIAMFNGDGALKPDAYQALYMQAVEPHLANIEMDEPRLIRDYGVAWVLVSMAVEAHRPVRPGDRLTAQTWNTTEKTRLLFRREMIIRDDAGETVFTAATFSAVSWGSSDCSQRRSCRRPITMTSVGWSLTVRDAAITTTTPWTSTGKPVAALKSREARSASWWALRR